MKFKILGLLIIILFVISGCSNAVEEQTGDEDNIVDEEDNDNPIVEDPVDENFKEFTIRASNWKFDPSEIRVNEGDKVILHIIGDDNGAGEGHGFSLTEFEINKEITEGETTTVEFVADKKGTFEFFCSVICGEGHREMRGQLIVE